MSVLKWLGISRFLLKKDVVPITSLKRFCTVEEPKPLLKSDLYALPEERAQIDLGTKLRYMKSKAYKATYGDLPVWTVYIRNFKGGLPPRPRKTCIFFGRLVSRNPCPICRDKYLVADYRNIDLLKQFISPYGGEILNNRKTGVCQKQHFNLQVAILKARNLGLLSFPVPFRRYKYSLYQK